MRNQSRDRGLAPTGAAEQSEDGSRFEAEAHPVEDQPVFVGKRDIIELDGQGAGTGGLVAMLEAALQFSQLVDPDEAAGGFLQLLQLLGHLFDRAADQLDVLQEQKGGTDGDRAAQN